MLSIGSMHSKPSVTGMLYACPSLEPSASGPTTHSQECGRLLKCGNHRCKAPCHVGKCLPCTRELHVACACGTTSYRLPCGSVIVCAVGRGSLSACTAGCWHIRLPSRASLCFQALAITSDEFQATACRVPPPCSVQTADGKPAPSPLSALSIAACHASAAMQRISRPTGRCRHVQLKRMLVLKEAGLPTCKQIGTTEEL